jgi:endonuclease/exonuclease/phosphatase family metal-dependent hydrolase
MQYNILHGFYNPLPNDKRSFDFEPQRLKAAQETVKQENPDILVLNEACFAQQNRYGILMNYQELFKYPHHYHAPTNYEWGTSVLSRFPITKVNNYSISKHPFVRLSLDLKGRALELNILHPHPTLTEEEKQRFIQSSIRDMGKPCLLVGDFNALSDEDNYDFDRLLRGFSTFDSHAANTVNELKKRLAVKAIRERGLKDTFVTAHKPFDYTVPTDFCSKNKDSAIRIDYIFCSEDIAVQDAYVVRNMFTEQASDHHPVVAVLNIK